MRVALVITKLAGLRGGAERVVIELALELVERGHDVTLVTYEASTELPDFDTGQVSLVNLFPAVLRRIVARRSNRAPDLERAIAVRGNGPIFARLKWAMTHGWFARRLARWLLRHRHDVVAGFLPPAISAVGLGAARIGSQRPRVIASIHSVPLEDFGPDGRWDPNPVTRRNNLRALEIADIVTVLQPEFIEQLPSAVQPNAVVLPNPVRRLGPPTDVERENLILGVGRLTTVKRFDVLIRAFAQIANELPGWRLEIHGSGPEENRLELLVAKLGLDQRVQLAGVTADLSPIYDRARLLVHPASYEGFGLAVAEAIMHGVPVIGLRDCTGVNRLVEHGASGLLVEETIDVVGAFAEGMLLMATTPPPVNQQQDAIDRLASRLAPTAVYDSWEALLAG